ncbi:DUF1971 domain-containing protein [Vallitalea okinawensis]|uniref:DUF1971 domain-containing protein n=1 Tax=Vallitalea okinawensis TaxID=2078660 RepID=UPI000CFDB712|nr:DUF1971 domain-containing protein [Vallitalea okinawensis]
MRFQEKKLPEGAVKVGETPLMNEETVLKPILNKHMAPRGKYGYVVVEKGSLQFVWEDNIEDVLLCDKEHPIVITPERYHHVIITGEVEFKVEFYKVKDISDEKLDEESVRPGEQFVK